MTKEEILAMEPGPELDTLVAEKIMNHPMPDFIPADALDLYLAGTPIHYDSWTCVCRYDEGDVPKWIPDPYSTDISAAWPIAVKMGLALIPLNNKDWACCKADHIYRVDIRQDHYADPNLVICKEAPEAICKVALIAK
ncbi:hypothetical protein ES703_84167 [subsurface metagenome]